MTDSGQNLDILVQYYYVIICIVTTLHQLKHWLLQLIFWY